MKSMNNCANDQYSMTLRNAFKISAILPLRFFKFMRVKAAVNDSDDVIFLFKETVGDDSSPIRGVSAVDVSFFSLTRGLGRHSI